MSILDQVLADLAAESDALAALLARTAPERWREPTPAAGWEVATTIAHLAWTDETAQLAARAGTGQDEGAWHGVVLEALADPEGFVDAEAARIASTVPADRLLRRWQESRGALALELRGYPRGERLPWFGPPMSPTSMASARFMETWAHGLDVYEALGAEPPRTDRIRHVAHLGVRTRAFSFVSRGLDSPETEVRVDLVSPGEEQWSWGPEDAAESVTGSAWDFARLVTRRVHHDDTDLVAVGPGAERWLRIAQAFAGPAGAGRAPRERR